MEDIRIFENADRIMVDAVKAEWQRTAREMNDLRIRDGIRRELRKAEMRKRIADMEKRRRRKNRCVECIEGAWAITCALIITFPEIAKNVIKAVFACK